MQNGDVPGIVSEIGGGTALYYAASVLWIHFVIVLLVAVVLTAFGLFANAASGRSVAGSQKGFGQILSEEGLDIFLYCSAFATFGIVTAYFLKLGLDPLSESNQNSLAQTFATPFISLLTAGVAYFAAKNRAEIAGNNLVLGVIGFLLACMLSYQTVLEQTHRRAATDIGGAIDSDVDMSTEERAGPQGPAERERPNEPAKGEGNTEDGSEERTSPRFPKPPPGLEEEDSAETDVNQAS